MATTVMRRFEVAVRDRLHKDFPRAYTVVNFLRNVAIDVLVTVFPKKFIGRYVLADEEAARGAGVRDVRVMLPAARVQIGAGDKHPFARVAQYYSDGWFDRP